MSPEKDPGAPRPAVVVHEVDDEIAGHYGASWPVFQAAFVEHVRIPMAAALPPVTVLGIDETRRGKPV